jgi:hypothetical protein
MPVVLGVIGSRAATGSDRGRGSRARSGGASPSYERDRSQHHPTCSHD